MGEIAVKNIERPVHVYSLRGLGGAATAPPPTDSRASICVLPFANMSGDPEQDYFSDGVTEDIITELSRISALRVAPRAIAFGQRARQHTIGEIARRLRVQFVLEGSVRRIDDRVRISAQLIDAANDANIWAERFDRKLEDIFALQAELATSIAAALKLRLLPAEKAALEQKPSASPEAYKLFLMARQYSVMGSERHEPVIERLCRRVVEIDPSYAPAWALLGATLTRMYRRNASDEDGEAAVRRALELDPLLPVAHAALSRILGDRGQLEAAAAEDAEALRLDPNCYEAHVSAGRNCILVRKHREGRTHFDRAAELVDTDFAASALAIQCNQALGDEAGARAAAKRALARIERIIAAEPDHGSALGHGAGILALLDEPKRAKEWAERALLLDPDNSNLIYNLACAMALAGETEAAIDYIDQLYSGPNVREEALRWAEHDNDLDPLRTHPRFIAVMEAAGARLRTR
jgi:adenylate cyclase